MEIDYKKNSKLTDFAKSVLKDRYLQPNEDYQDMFARVAKAYANDEMHAQRLYRYMSDLWFMPATPILSNGGTGRGLPISCFLQEIQDTMESIDDNHSQTFWLAARGGGIGVNWSNLRSIGTPVGEVGKTSGIIPFIKMQDSMTLAVSQGSLRRGSSAAYLHISHPEIREFINIRKPTGGDPDRKCLNVHNAVIIPDEFMYAVKDNSNWELIDPYTEEIIDVVKARDLWHEILILRLETGEPYIIFEDTANDLAPSANDILGNKIKMSNLCSEILLPTGIDHLGNNRTAVCCLSSLNLELYEEWKDKHQFYKDVLYFLDNVLQDFIDRTKGVRGFKDARYSAIRERSIGLGVMGFHYYLQKNNIPFGSVMAKVHNNTIFKNIDNKVYNANVVIGMERGRCLDNEEAGLVGRFLNATAIAPTASISVICGGTSPSVEPLAANVFTHKTLSGSFTVKNRYLKRLLKQRDQDKPEVWESITMNEGSVQHLDFLTQDEKDVFKTFEEINQQWIIELAADRAKYINQGQSINIHLPSNVDKYLLSKLHYDAWEKGVKSLYYCRSKSIQRAEKDNISPNKVLGEPVKYEECLSCQ